MPQADGLMESSAAPHVGRTFGWRQLPEALAYLQSGRSVGKVVVTMDAADSDAPEV